MAQMTKHHIAGVIENMSSFTCPGCGETHHIFGRGGAFEIAQAMQTTLLGRIPLDESDAPGRRRRHAGGARPRRPDRRRLPRDRRATLAASR